MTFEQIKELIDIVCRRSLQVLEIERSDFRLRIEGQATDPAAASHTADGEAASAVKEAPASILAASASGADDEDEPQQSLDGAHVISSPIVGTFYAAPSPDSDPYVQVGDEVRIGQVLCIVEAMKLMNEIESDVDGEVLEIFGRNAQPVEFGEPLFSIRPG